MSLAYKVEELLALRDSVSESAVSLDKFADEDVIKGKRSLYLHLSHLTLHSSLITPHSSPHQPSLVVLSVLGRTALPSTSHHIAFLLPFNATSAVNADLSV